MKDELPAPLIEESLRIHSAYFHILGDMLDEIAAHHPQFVPIDVHSYNHRRGDAFAEPSRQEDAPDINIGTFFHAT